MPKLIDPNLTLVFAIDFDNCAFSKLCDECMTKISHPTGVVCSNCQKKHLFTYITYQSLTNPDYHGQYKVRFTINPDSPLFQHIISEIFKYKPCEVIICSFSNRQDFCIEILNSQEKHTISSFLALEALAMTLRQLFNTNYQPSIKIDKFLLADIIAKPNVAISAAPYQHPTTDMGTTWNTATTAITSRTAFPRRDERPDSLKVITFSDAAKLLLHRTLMHRYSSYVRSQRPGSVHLNMYDDFKNILDANAEHFGNDGRMLPDNYSFSAFHYDPYHNPADSYLPQAIPNPRQAGSFVFQGIGNTDRDWPIFPNRLNDNDTELKDILELTIQEHHPQEALTVQKQLFAAMQRIPIENAAPTLALRQSVSGRLASVSQPTRTPLPAGLEEIDLLSLKSCIFMSPAFSVDVIEKFPTPYESECIGRLHAAQTTLSSKIFPTLEGSLSNDFLLNLETKEQSWVTQFGQLVLEKKDIILMSSGKNITRCYRLPISISRLVNPVGTVLPTPKTDSSLICCIEWLHFMQTHSWRLSTNLLSRAMDAPYEYKDYGIPGALGIFKQARDTLARFSSVEALSLLRWQQNPSFMQEYAALSFNMLTFPHMPPEMTNTRLITNLILEERLFPSTAFGGAYGAGFQFSKIKSASEYGLLIQFKSFDALKGIEARFSAQCLIVRKTKLDRQPTWEIVCFNPAPSPSAGASITSLYLEAGGSLDSPPIQAEIAEKLESFLDQRNYSTATPELTFVTLK